MDFLLLLFVLRLNGNQGTKTKGFIPSHSVRESP